jgi:tRNA pseudouridine55 synthase
MSDGFLNLNKPTGISSRAAVDLVVKLVGRKTRVGHAGTLDPLASGVLVVGLGAGTRLIERVQDQPKVYRTVIRLGATSDTLDADGRISEMSAPPVPTPEQVRGALATQVGTIAQVPPQYSALKVAGRRAYDLARQGESVELAPRDVVIDRVDLLSYAWPRLELEIACGGGTYIRSIARDVGEALGCGGYVEVLVRTRIGPFRIEEAIDPRDLDAASWPGLVRPLIEAVPDLPRVDLTPEQVTRIRRGQFLDVRRLSNAPPPGDVALIDPTGVLVAIAEHDPGAGLIRPRRVLVQSGTS